MLVLNLLALVAPVFAAEPNCPAELRAAGPATVAAQIQTGARATAGDPCPDHKASGSDEEQSQLLEAIRKGTLARINKTIERTESVDPARLADKYVQMRIFMSLRDARVRVDPKGRLVVEPALSFAHRADFASLADLKPNERAMLDKQIAPLVDAANARFTRGHDARAGKDLLDQLRAQGANGYTRAIAEEPALLYAEFQPTSTDEQLRIIAANRGKSPINFKDANDSYREDLKNGLRDLPQLEVRPPRGAVVGMVYFGPAVADVVRARPELCAAFHSLLQKAGRLKRVQNTLSWATVSLDSLCVRGPIKFFSMVGVGCLAVAAATSYAVGNMAAAEFEHQQLLYGGVPDARDGGTTPSAAPAQTAELK